MKNNIKEERSKRQLTQAELAERVQVSRQTIISIESGRYLPSTVLALKLAKELKRPVEDLFVLEKSD
jgi:putative transcriptional regulator